MTLSEIIWLLIGLGLGAIAAGWFTNRTWRRAFRQMAREIVLSTHSAPPPFEIERLRNQLLQRDRECAEWHRRYLVAAAAQHIAIDVNHHVPPGEGEEWKRQ